MSLTNKILKEAFKKEIVSGESVYNNIKKHGAENNDNDFLYREEKNIKANTYSIKKISIEDLLMNDKSARQFIEESKEYFGEINNQNIDKRKIENPILLNTSGKLIDGHHRLAQAYYTGKKTIIAYVPISVTDKILKEASPNFIKSIRSRYDEVINNYISDKGLIKISLPILIKYHPNDNSKFYTDKSIKYVGGKKLIKVFKFHHLSDENLLKRFEENNDKVPSPVVMVEWRSEGEIVGIKESFSVVDKILKEAMERPLLPLQFLQALSDYVVDGMDKAKKLIL